MSGIRISIGLITNACMLLVSSNHRWTRDRSLANREEFVRCQVRSNETYSEANLRFSVRNRDVLMNAQSPHKWWSILKSAVLALSSSLLPFLGVGSGLVCESVGKAVILSDHFDTKQFRKSVNLSLSCHPSLSLITIAFRQREVSRLLLDLDPYGGADPLGMFPPFLKKTADVLTHRLCSVLAAYSSRLFPCLLERGQCHPNSERSTVLLCCQLPTYFHNISIV